MISCRACEKVWNRRGGMGVPFRERPETTVNATLSLPKKSVSVCRTAPLRQPWPGGGSGDGRGAGRGGGVAGRRVGLRRRCEQRLLVRVGDCRRVAVGVCFSDRRSRTPEAVVV